MSAVEEQTGTTNEISAARPTNLMLCMASVFSNSLA